MFQAKCPECNSDLEWTYKIDEDFYKTHDCGDPRIYGVICTNCCYERYDDEDNTYLEEGFDR